MSNNRTVKKPPPPGGQKPPAKGYVAPTPKKSGRVSPLVLVVVSVVVVGVVAAIAVALTSGGDTVRTDPGVQQTRSVTVEGDPLPAFKSGPADPAVGLAAPTVTGQTFGGTPITINPGGGEKYTMLAFAAHWCPHCQKEIPVIADWMTAGKKPANLDVYGVSTGVRTDYMSSQLNWPSSAWFERVGWPMDTVLADSGPDQEQAGEEPNAAANAYGLTGYPMMVMVGPDGNVIERHSGEFGVQGNPETFEAWIARTMAAAG